MSVPLINAAALNGASPERLLPMKGLDVDAVARSAVLEVLLTALDGSNTQARLRTVDDNTDNVAASGDDTWLGVLSRLTGFDGTNWDRLRTLLDNADGQAFGTPGLLGTMTRLMAYNEASYDRVRTLLSNTDDYDPDIIGLLGTVSRLQGFNGAAFDRLYTASTDVIGSKSSIGALLSAPPGEFAVEHRPAAATAATIGLAAVPGSRWVCRSVTASLVATAAQGQIDVLLRDGATGAGTVLWSTRIAALAGTSVNVSLAGLNIAGSVNTAMTLEFAAAPAATNFAGVALTAYDAVTP